MAKEIKVEWCEEFIKSRFSAKHHAYAGKGAGIEVGFFWRLAEESGLWERGTYGSPMSEALSNLTEVDSVLDENGCCAYNVFRMKEA